MRDGFTWWSPELKLTEIPLMSSRVDGYGVNETCRGRNARAEGAAITPSPENTKPEPLLVAGDYGRFAENIINRPLNNRGDRKRSYATFDLLRIADNNYDHP